MSNQINKVINTAFGPVQLPPQEEKTNVTEVDIVDTLIIDTFEQDEEGNIRAVTKQIVTGKKNRKDYIESFADECGLPNILEKIGAGAIAEDKFSILRSNKVGEVNDLRGFQDIQNAGDVQSLGDKARALFATLDPELKGNMTFAEFCTKFDNQKLNDYVAKKTAVPLEGDSK